MVKLLLYVGLILGAAGLGWSQSDDRARGSRGSYHEPVERPTLPMPGGKQESREQMAAGPAATDYEAPPQTEPDNQAAPAAQSQTSSDDSPGDRSSGY